MSNIIIKRAVGDDRLGERTWHLCVRLGRYGMPELYLYSYWYGQRPTTRHKFKQVEAWHLYDRRNNTATYQQATPPPDVIAEALEQVKSAIVFTAPEPLR